MAVSEGEIVGTNTLTFDGIAGLQADSEFKAQCDKIRAEERRLACCWRIVTRFTAREESKIVLGLMAESINLALTSGVETCVFTCHPKHRRVYQRLLNMKPLAESLSTDGLSNAPAVFMRCDLESLPGWCMENFGATRKMAKSA